MLEVWKSSKIAPFFLLIHKAAVIKSSSFFSLNSSQVHPFPSFPPGTASGPGPHRFPPGRKQEPSNSQLHTFQSYPQLFK